MALVVEDGSVIAGAESYASVTFADAYHSNRGNTAWATLATTDKEVALRKATDYLIQNYRASWKGWRASTTQRLDWPRVGVEVDDYAYNQNGGVFANLIASNTVPLEVQNVCCVLALVASTAELAPDLTRSKLKVQAGPVAVEYDPKSPTFTRYRAVEMALSPYLEARGAMVKLGRV